MIMISIYDISIAIAMMLIYNIIGIVWLIGRQWLYGAPVYCHVLQVVAQIVLWPVGIMAYAFNRVSRGNRYR
jgi:hypothetical protein